jgi:hypothetical protein
MRAVDDDGCEGGLAFVSGWNSSIWHVSGLCSGKLLWLCAKGSRVLIHFSFGFLSDSRRCD